MQLDQLGFPHPGLERKNNHAPYLGHWLTILKGHTRAIFSAAAHAQRAADYLQQLQPPSTEQAA